MEQCSPKVSVAFMTYNHQPYIVQAIESVLMQETNFDFEIVIGEDCSTDGTREIVLDYEKRYPDLIRVLPREQNIGGRKNFVSVLESCRGQYIALLDGDDYWISKQKLQKQVNLLDARPELSMCFHPATWICENGNGESFVSRPRQEKNTYTLRDLLGGNFMTANSVVFRNGLFGIFPDWFYKTAMGDVPLYVLNAQHGDIGYIDEVMSVYRNHGAGVWSKLSKIEQSQRHIDAFNYINEHLENQYEEIIQGTICYQQYLISYRHESAGDIPAARKAFHEVLKNFRACPISKKKMLEMSVKLYLPWIAKLYRLLRGNAEERKGS